MINENMKLKSIIPITETASVYNHRTPKENIVIF